MLVRTSAGAVTQRFGPSLNPFEPMMFAAPERAYWLAVPGLPGLTGPQRFHPGLDRRGETGDAIKAMQDGVVTFASWKDGISGFQIEVQVNPICRFSINHLKGFNVRFGDPVRQGQTIAFMDNTGASTGPHGHTGVGLYEPGPDGIWRTFLWDPELFQKGGKYADDHRIEPEQRHVALDGVGVNLLLAPPHMAVQGPYARSMDPPNKKAGIFRRGTGNRIAPLDKEFPLLYWRNDRDLGRLAIVHAFGHRLAIRDEHVHYTD